MKNFVNKSIYANSISANTDIQEMIASLCKNLWLDKYPLERYLSEGMVVLTN